MIDLHTHSTASDGSYKPAELIDYAKSLGLNAIALTDHDTSEGNFEASAQAEKIGITFIPGIEISADYGKGNIHILGYFIDPADKKLRVTLKELVDYRIDRNHKIVAKFRELGFDIVYSEVEALAGSEVVGRPHFAKLLIDKGYASTTQEVFDNYLASGKAAYFPKKRLTPQDSIELIRNAGGFPVLAHPGQYKFPDEKTLRNTLEELISLGLKGLEVFYSDHTPEQTALYIRLANEYGLTVTGGSDFHGSMKPAIKLGLGRGLLNIEDNILTDLKSAYSKLYNK